MYQNKLGDGLSFIFATTNPFVMTIKYTEITEVHLSAFFYRLFHEDFMKISDPVD